MFNIFNRKPNHTCDWELVAVNEKYYTTYTDIQKTVYWEMRFYKCNCGKRKLTDNLRNKKHEGIEKARKNWIDAGVVPANSTHPLDDSQYIQVDNIEREKLDPVLEYQKTIDDLVMALGVVLNRDFNLEEQYPSLKEAADEYHRRLSKYRNFESLKKPNNE